MPMMTGSKLFAQMLQAYEVTHVFYLPAIMMGGLAEMEEMNIRRIMTHGEKASAYMADGYARASGKPGVCLAQQIGASNLAAGLRDAYMAGTPLLAFTGGPSPAARYKNAYQEVEDFTQFDAVTKSNSHIEHVSRMPDQIRQAFRTATSGAPGPVHLQFQGLHGQVANAKADLDPTAEKQYTRIPPFRPAPEQHRVDAALKLLASAQRPILVAGGGVVASGAQAELVRLAEKLQIPVATSLNAKGAISDRSPLAVGVAGTYSRACANRAIHEADLVFFIGSHTGGQLTVNWCIPGAGTTVIQLDIDPLELGRNYPNAVSLACDAQVGLQMLADGAQARSGAHVGEWLQRVAQLVGEWRAEAEPMRASDAMPIRPERICKEISDVLPKDGIVVSDTGHSGMWTGAMIELKHLTQQFVRCAGSMGWGFPGAMGVKCAHPDRAVVCFTGDGAFYYHIAELETAARHKINLVVVVNNNSALNQEIPLWENAYGDKPVKQPEDVWTMGPTNFAQVAESLGCVGIRVEKPGELKGALEKALSLGRPVVIDVVSDIDAFATKAWLPAGVVNGH